MPARNWALHVKVSVFCKPEDDLESVRSALVKLFPFDLAGEKIKVEESRAEGFNDRQIRILDVFIKKESLTQVFLKHLMSNLSSDQKEFLLRHVMENMDDRMNFMIDLDKNRLQVGQFWAVQKGPCYHIRVRMAAFPKTREAAAERVRDMLSYESRNV